MVGIVVLKVSRRVDPKPFLVGPDAEPRFGHLDAEGFVFITGRAPGSYIRGGFNVQPR